MLPLLHRGTLAGPLANGPANLRDEPGTEAGRSPSGPVSGRPCSRACRTRSSAASWADGSGLFYVTSSRVALIAAPLPLNIRLSDQGRKHL